MNVNCTNLGFYKAYKLTAGAGLTLQFGDYKNAWKGHF